MKTVSELVFFSILLLLLLVVEAKSKKNQTGCESFNCGSLDFKFPFFSIDMPSRCGLFRMNCSGNISEIQLVENGKWYKVKSVSQANTITVIDTRLNQSLETGNCSDLSSFSLPDSPWLDLKTLYKCNNTRKNGFTFANCGGSSSMYYYNSSNDVSECLAIKTPESWVVPRNKNQFDVNATFSLHLNLPSGCFRCHGRGGECKMIKHKYRCVGATKEQNFEQERIRLGLGIGGSIIFIIILVAFLIIIHRICKRRSGARGSLSRGNSKSDVELFFKIPIFSYKELQEATNNFNKERLVGDGGFGTVYYGKLRDGREVAVKRLYEHNYRRLEQFMNEIEILTRLHHKNLVSLYGCTSRRSRELLLVYEFIPNGTVADHLHGENPSHRGYLTWSMRLSIAIETASALAYLHASDIIHRDVKTTNILLDANFSVKVADFGLSRLFPSDATHVSTAPQGTPGYVDPEYHQCYHLTDKSDVYSFGVVLIELISSKPAVDISRCKNEINLSSLAINKIQNHGTHELIDPNLGYETDRGVRRMTTMVAELAFQCLQQDNTVRPTMEQVVQELKGIQNYNRDGEETITMMQPPSPSYWDEASLIKNMRFPRSPISVTDQWTSKSTTPNTSTYDYP